MSNSSVNNIKQSFQRDVYCRNISLHTRLSRIIPIDSILLERGRDVYANEKFHLALNTHLYVRDLIAREIKFTPCRDETQLKHFAPSYSSNSRDGKIEALEARLRRKVRVSFPKHFSFIRRVFAVLPASSSGLSGKKLTPVSARTRFNLDAL